MIRRRVALLVRVRAHRYRQLSASTTAANMLAMPGEQSVRASRAGLMARPGSIASWAQPVAAITALIVALVGILGPFYPRGELWLLVIPIALGLMLGPVAQRVTGWSGHRLAQPVATFTVLLIMALWLPAEHDGGGPAPLWFIVLPLCAGLAPGPISRLVRRHPVPGSVLSLAALVAVLVQFWMLVIDSGGYYIWPLGTIRPVVILLAFVLVIGEMSQHAVVRRFLQPATTLGALVGLTFTLFHEVYIWPAWSLWFMAIVMACGLAAELLIAIAGQPDTRVLTQRVAELSRTRRGALDVQATELRRIERDLHDGAQVRLVALSLKLGRAEDRYRDDPETAALLREAREDATAAIRELRELARGIAPPVLADRGLGAAVQSIAQRSGIEVRVDDRLTRRPTPAVELAAYFVVAESLTNAAKHAPGARVEIRLDDHGEDVFVDITDFGPGGADASGSGLTGLRQRVEALDGSFTVTSPVGAGTQIEAILPAGR